MKLIAATTLLGLSVVNAFAPAAKPASSTALFHKIPGIPATPWIGSDNGYILGEPYWDKLTQEIGSEDTGEFIKAAELKHGRSAMIATVGFAFHKLGLTFNNISPHEYLSVTKNIKFADLAAMTPADAIKAVPAEGLCQMFIAIAIIEFYELTHRDGKFVAGETVAPGLQPGGLTGDLKWNPLDIKITERRKLVERQNGRAAMFAISAWVAHDAIAGSVPLTLPWN
jgi:hypothetical protein